MFDTPKSRGFQFQFFQPAAQSQAAPNLCSQTKRTGPGKIGHFQVLKQTVLNNKPALMGIIFGSHGIDRKN